MEEEIVVYRKFENTIEANIVKTKLDAYGVPCFLTEENLSNLYPGQSFMFFNVRLHLFVSDVERANQIMEEHNLIVNDEISTKCPNCKSINIKRDYSESLKNKFDAFVDSLLALFVPVKKVYHCEDCRHEFKS